jgi:hypothetical protein
VSHAEFKGKAGDTAAVRVAGSGATKVVAVVGLGEATAAGNGAEGKLGKALAALAKQHKSVGSMAVVLPAGAAPEKVAAALAGALYSDNRFRTGEGVGFKQQKADPRARGPKALLSNHAHANQRRTTQNGYMTGRARRGWGFRVGAAGAWGWRLRGRHRELRPSCRGRCFGTPCRRIHLARCPRLCRIWRLEYTAVE